MRPTSSRTLRKLLSAAGAGGLLLLLSVPGHAGTGYSTQIANCYRAADGSGACQGTFVGFRNAPYANAWASFEVHSTVGYFTGVKDATNYGYCMVSSPSPMWQTAVSSPPNTYFSITWDAAGICGDLYLEGVSAYQ